MRHRRTLAILAGALTAAATIFACGSTDGTPGGARSGGVGSSPGGSSSAGSGNGSGVGGSGVGGNGGSIFIDPNQSGGAGGITGDACGLQTFQGEGVPLSLYVMYDQSTSMTCPAGSGSRWSVVTTAFQRFLSSPQAVGIGIGIQYFGMEGDCNAARYYQPDVPIAPLPGNLQALNNSLQAHSVIGINLTTTNAALIGAIDQARSFKQMNPAHVVAVLLVTDGQPTACGTVQDAANTAANGVNGSPSVRTFVLGIVAGAGSCDALRDANPPNVPDLDLVAAAGGTDHAYIVDPGSGSADQDLLNALDAIRGTAQLACQYQLPSSSNGQPTDPNQVNVEYTPAGGTPTKLYQVPDISQCGSQPGAWYYDQNYSIVLCGSTCTAVTQAAGGKVDVAVGCPTITKPPE